MKCKEYTYLDYCFYFFKSVIFDYKSNFNFIKERMNMKRRNLFLGLLLAISCAIVGVGYATLTRELKIGGQLAG